MRRMLTCVQSKQCEKVFKKHQLKKKKKKKETSVGHQKTLLKGSENNSIGYGRSCRY